MPIVVLYNKRAKTITFTLIKTTLDEQLATGLNEQDEEDYIKTIE